MKIRFQSNTNIRTSPGTQHTRRGVILAGNEIEVQGQVKGELIHDNDVWFYDGKNNFYWSGGVEKKTILNQLQSAIAPFINYREWIAKDNPSFGTSLASSASEIKIALLDSGIYEDHPDFKGSFFLPGIDMTATTGAADKSGHGSHVAGLIAARSDDNVGIIGVTPTASLWNIKVLDDEGNSSGEALLKGLKAIQEYLALSPQNKIHIINLSLSLTYTEYLTVEKIIEELAELGVIIVASAGNNDKLISLHDIYYPAHSPYVISVGAINKTFVEANPVPHFNKRVEFILSEMLLKSCSTKEKMFYTDSQGSSMATALVSGIIAQLIASTTQPMSLTAVRQALAAIAIPYNGGNYILNTLTLIKPNTLTA